MTETTRLNFTSSNGTGTFFDDDGSGTMLNGTDPHEYYYIYDKVYIRIIFISLYTIVFCLCFFGNLLVILVVTLSRRLRSITNFFLANLAVADFFVAIFCVYQNLFIYIVESWILEDFLCKMYMFIQSVSNTASIFILVVICTERYFAIIYPITCKQILTPFRLKETTAKPFAFSTDRKYNSELFDMIHFVLFYVIPLAIMSLLYTRIAVCLWNSSEQLKKQLDASAHSTQYQDLCRKQSTRQSKKTQSNSAGDAKLLQNTSSNGMSNPNSSQKVLRARRGVIKMLIIVVCAFAICNLPFHARKMWQYWSSNYHGDTNFSAILTPLTFLSTYFNSGVNPLLYAFLSKNFRRGMREILLCSCPRRKQQDKKNHINLYLQRRASTRSTMKGNATTVTIMNNDPSSECSHEV
ncbi:hypothetical protein NQ315_005520 [Exocentrus adspersus]|uniref:G-protein coupled receptors family 1 profile domain-containing protein n=1 Tax=Exocentrus adspersus TaxID=1586481 RepID=A0AAV8VT29_9CUCU|nr:hypothetical protein NQ315_005520 [Exocentrus adspersus]